MSPIGVYGSPYNANRPPRIIPDRGLVRLASILDRGPPRRTPIAVQYYITHHTAASRDKTRITSTNERREAGAGPPKGSRNKPGAQKTGRFEERPGGCENT